MIQEWFDKKGSYTEGIRLLEKVCGKNNRIYLRLKNSKDNQRNKAALKYELTKYLKKSTPIPKENISPATKNPTTHTSIDNDLITEKRIVTSIKHNNEKVTISMSPDAHLQKRFMEKSQVFYKRSVLKMKLNNLPSEAEETALQISMEIIKLTTLLDTIWSEIDYFLAHKKRMPEGKDYSSLSPVSLVKEKQNIFQRISKRKKTLDKWKKLLPNTPKNKQLALQSKIEKQIEELTQMEMDLQNVNELMNT